ncbi:MAG: class I SAM-dependent methyltransferase [Dermabacter sp.]|nr:class I SAM-dependent methyltransferase [Dermabacter sp.]
MLDYAAARPGGDAVQWRLGTSEQIAPHSTDVVIMSGNVAMHIIGDDWHRSRRDISRGLREGGRLVFETRNPLARAWEHWNDAPSERDTPVGRIRESRRVEGPDEHGILTMYDRTKFLADGSVLEADMRLQFRSLEQVRADLADAGLRITDVWRDWHRTPFTSTAREPLMVIEAEAVVRRA